MKTWQSDLLKTATPEPTDEQLIERVRSAIEASERDASTGVSPLSIAIARLEGITAQRIWYFPSAANDEFVGPDCDRGRSLGVSEMELGRIGDWR